MGQTSRSLHLGLKTDMLKVMIKYDKGYSAVYIKYYEYRTAQSVTQSLWKEESKGGGRRRNGRKEG